jgi:hypothetical protein
VHFPGLAYDRGDLVAASIMAELKELGTLVVVVGKAVSPATFNTLIGDVEQP